MLIFKTTARNSAEWEIHLRIAGLLENTELTAAEKEMVINAALDVGLLPAYEFLKDREIRYTGLAQLLCDLYESTGCFE